MKLNTEFTWEKAQQTLESLVFQQTGKHLSDLEIVVLRGAWDNKTYEEIAEAEGYTSNYLSKDVGNKLWSNLSLALQEKVSKKNFRAALQRKYYNQAPSNLAQYQPQLSEFSTENLTFPEGSVALESPFYIERSLVESLCYQTVIKPGSLIRIKAAKWMGKTSLVNRILEQGRVSGHKTVYLDFGSIERSILKDLDKLLRWLCVMVSRQLELTNEVNDYWDTDILGSNDNCTVYFEEYISAEITSEIVLALDNIDKLFSYEEVIEDFFGMLRSWHEKGKIDDSWAKFKLILAHSTEVYIPLDIHQSPFNAGVPILLEEFTHSQVETLASWYQLNWDKSQITKLMDLVGGHPYLVRLAMYQIKTSSLNLEQFLQGAISETGIYSNPLRRLLNILKQSPELSSVFEQVVKSDKPVELNSLQIYQLHSIGLVQHQQNFVSPRCKLYRDYFKRVF
ncbi:AAA-like domain-containing protein [Pleurocapsa sp. PCC 7319]|uniref:AAA-like domain-containing protein n=1 Tax=Pleurocapsa sp. PCC 7319 TaxID=118161 RepID=UPI000347326F|nr:AAA-like domain-containing protein [Pleurocapsa sp. PCC 7319]